MYNTPRGIQYNKKQLQETNYQLFPESYFTGADVKIYFGDLFIDEILGITFALTENRKPLYSYASRTFKEVAISQRIVQGKFYIAFREAGYLSGVFDHLGQLGSISQQENSIKDIIIKGNGNTKSKYVADALTTFDALLSKIEFEVNGVDKNKVVTTNYEKEIWGRRSSNDSEHSQQPFFFSSRTNKDYQASLQTQGFDVFFTYGPLEQSETSTINGNQYTSFNTTIKAIRNVHITNYSQEISPDNLIVEVYDFFAKDID